MHKSFLHPDRCIYILFGMNSALLPDLPCLCANLRRASRALTQVYEDALRPVGLRGPQFTILQTLSIAGEITQGRMAQILAMDSTTLTRTLAIMERQGWIARREGEDRREWRIQLSKAGRSKFERALPHWEKAQALVRKKLGERGWGDAMKFSNDITRAVVAQRS
jgi:DNA-binding MarR family transcriptional regulator